MIEKSFGEGKNGVKRELNINKKLQKVKKLPKYGEIT